MAGKVKSVYVCNSCGYESPKWNGRCPECGEWNTFVEEKRQAAPAKVAAQQVFTGKRAVEPTLLVGVDEHDETRYLTGIGELDRVLGGGIVKGSLVLLGGEPGIGKSTLLLQICKSVAENHKVLYVSGEESVRQIKLRANRLGVDSGALFLLSETDIETVIDTVLTQKPDVVMVDSIQTMSFAGISSSQGSVSQVRECTSLLMKVAKSEEIPVILVGHVNKDGAIAGPKVLEHIVDAVLQFEGERHLNYRVLRAVKNRYGSTNEIGMFEMGDAGLIEVANPSAMLLSDRPVGVPGSCVACIIEGSRPVFTEVQALVTKSPFATPRRMSTGFDYNRASLLIAVLEKRGGYFFGVLDAYINVIGGIRLDEPAADLSVCLALVSSLTDKPIAEGTLAFGEVGLSGEIRAVSNAAQRIKEAVHMGFTKVILPKSNLRSLGLGEEEKGVKLVGVGNIRDAIAQLG